MRRRYLSRGFLVPAVSIIALVVLPFGVNLYYVDVLTLLLINVILVVSMRFIALMGEYTASHIPLMGVGAYTLALMTTRLGWSFWATLPVAGLFAALVALILSYPLLRMKGLYFFVGSFAAGEAMRLSWLRFDFFGAQRGIGNIPIPSLLGVDFHNITAFYFLTLVVTLICLVVMYRLEYSKIGDTIKSIQAQDSLAQSVGINLWNYKAFAHVTGSFFAGIAGALCAARLGSVTPFEFVFSQSLYLYVWLFFGGMGSFAGPLLGLVTLTGVTELMHAMGGLEEWTPLIYGFLLVLTLLILPKGIISLPKRISQLRQKSSTVGPKWQGYLK